MSKRVFNNSPLGANRKKPDYILLGAIIALVGFGLVMLSSASAVISEQKFQTPYYYFKHQLLYGVLIGAVLFALIQLFDYRFFKKIALSVFLFSIGLLILVFIPPFGSYYKGASRWLNLGFVSIQPSEVLKLTIILYLAAWFEKKGDLVKDFRKGVLPFIGVVGLVSILFIMQPDIGTLGMILLITVVLLFVAGVRWKHLLGMFCAGIAGLFFLIKSASYRADRLLVFLHPELDPHGIGYQINQALLAIGSGGILGLGLGRSRQKFNYLPEPAGDSIFAVIAEELGLLGVLFLIGLLVVIAVRGYRIAKRADDKFIKLTAIGITSWFVFQAIINIAAISSLIPLTGIPLPFVSYGSSSMVMTLVGAGILFNFSRYTI